ncbi:DUF6268 family outer membrane beta-barrel protein [Desulfonatronovibrio hydrogenovorans]|uniref:DUF6268 family outer membrane beta-barrel protein n=1 Tax=Desulfonatronovibrio hydrogenovorans TaxID=53245 RepID=UPI00048AB13C|nr:DUF6268 family outer membrane beta-barrel protein [Desulfonatronovibrio hydrogenovorans]
MKNITKILICSVIVTIFFSTGLAQGETLRDISITTSLDHRFKTEIKNSDAKVSSTRYGLEGTFSHFTLAYDYIDYSWDKAGQSGLTSNRKKPWDQLHFISLGANKYFILNQDWSLNLGGGISSAFEKEMSDSFGARAFFFLVRSFEHGWSAGLGLAGSYHPVKSSVFPGFVLGYAPTGTQGFSARVGFPETGIRYGFNRNLALDAKVGYTSGIFRLENNSPVERKGYFREQAVKTGVSLEISPTESLFITLGPYLLLERQWRIYDKSKNRVSRQRLDSGAGAEIALLWRF